MNRITRVSSVALPCLLMACGSHAEPPGGAAGAAGSPTPGSSGRGGATATGGGGTAGTPVSGGAPGSGGGAGGQGAVMDAGAADIAGRGGMPGTSSPDARSDAGGATDAVLGPPQGPPAGTVAMFIASGQGGRVVTSCDDGLTWKAHDFPVTAKDEFNEKGIAFGHGVFMRVMGWGAPCSFMRSDDGVNWQRLALRDVGLPSMSECGGITYNGDGFTMVHWTGATYASDHEGLKWQKIGMFDNSNEHVREIVGDGPAPGVVLAGGANDPAGVKKNPPKVSIDGGKSWKATPGCSTLHAISIGQEGGGALGAGRMVYVGIKGEVCTSTDMTTWQETQLPGVTGFLAGKVNFDGESFWVADSSRVFVSSNGLAWTERKLAAPVKLHAVARSSRGTWVGFNRTNSSFYRSVDSTTWTPAMGPAHGPELYRLIHGYGKPSAECPLK